MPQPISLRKQPMPPVSVTRRRPRPYAADVGIAYHCCKVCPGADLAALIGFPCLASSFPLPGRTPELGSLVAAPANIRFGEDLGPAKAENYGEACSSKPC